MEGAKRWLFQKLRVKGAPLKPHQPEGLRFKSSKIQVIFSVSKNKQGLDEHQ